MFATGQLVNVIRKKKNWPTFQTVFSLKGCQSRAIWSKFLCTELLCQRVHVGRNQRRLGEVDVVASFSLFFSWTGGFDSAGEPAFRVGGEQQKASCSHRVRKQPARYRGGSNKRQWWPCTSVQPVRHDYAAFFPCCGHPLRPLLFVRFSHHPAAAVFQRMSQLLASHLTNTRSNLLGPFRRITLK